MSQGAMADALRNGRYVIRGLLGEGSQGQTLDAIDMREGRPVAIKRFDVRGARGWKDVELAERDARVLQSLSHPLLPLYVEHFEEGSSLYLVMERIEGESLAAIRRRGGVFGVDDASRLLRDAASA
ncbi:MAG: serine/threonine protein kinase, partial [Polyangiaceae bacterium]|nr:serine/threonine protein kinase [Polyangiaceae bacterium]